MAKNKQTKSDAGEAQVIEQPVEQQGDTTADKTMDFSCHGFDFTISAPYAEGHVINGPEAYTLNQTRLENIRNNTAGKVKTAIESAQKENRSVSDEELDALKAELAKYDAEYVFQGRRTGSRAPADPVKRKAVAMARETITTALRSRDIKVADLADGKMEELITQYLAGHPEVTDEAKRQVEASKAAATDALSGVELGDMLKPAPAPVEQPVEEPADAPVAEG